MSLSPLDAISPIDGRYRKISAPLADYFSEGALIRYRTRVEIEYFLALVQLPLPQLENFDKTAIAALRAIYADLNPENMRRVKTIEGTTNHDVKAVEYFLKEKFDELGLAAFSEFVHFGLTSQDINNTAMPLALKEAWQTVMAPCLAGVVDTLTARAREWKKIPMLARTHGQPASPTTMGKEIYVFVDRLNGQRALLDGIPFGAKFGGAVGNFNAHRVAFPKIDWIDFADHFVNDILGLRRSRITTQIDHYDQLAAFCDAVKRINTILIDFCRDVWTYVALDYFKQKIKADEVGSSAMPHKINPIDFENAEGNLGVSNAVFEHLAAKLPVSRLQRDLSDSTVVRNIGVPLAHSLIAWKSLLRGMDKLVINQDSLSRDLEANWAVVAEAWQTILRREGYPRPYEALKALTRIHGVIDARVMAEFVAGLGVSAEVKDELLAVTPHNYTGIIDF